ncbi:MULTISPECIES: hypothetical protein [Enterobacter]|jgi:hypothetical protein|uniref:hypothetical protein n=1 Tax=Enterobacter TaxID=547 RepID=UPI000A8728F0|nr:MULTISPECIES: hypothetical protein [Enterobacter]MBZ6366205.1 hypothetical protein [Enterobacter bugandensis]NUX25248.1 hypothetical protein [Enterobacter bugandensis]NUX48109.1 hypothetical protein [Enterobacter bugandensis]NUX69063.1 hypothetical protein [Enterobacter bugandensis]NUX94387.1 hypothetical protein [Enterobacter bugandensis]
MDLVPASKELKRAKRCVERMRSAKSYDEYDEAWSDYLSRIENVFGRVKVAAESHKNYPSFSSSVNHLRATDSLLIYLKQARNAVHHGIVDTSKYIQGGFGINPPTPGGILRLDSITIDGNGNAHIVSRSPFRLDIIPDSIEAIPCRNRGVTYNPPESHLGEEIKSKNPVDIAELGIKFYESYLAGAEETFLKK